MAADITLFEEDFSGTNIIVIVPDDQRWDATGFMQDRIDSLGRTARFSWISGYTPGMDRLSEEGIHFDNGFAVYSLCSPSRATMLTGKYPHLNGVVNNEGHFPTNSATYATLLQDAGYVTGYFGKWHMGDQEERPGFNRVATFYGQGHYYGTTFYNENGSVDSTYTGWIDDVSTDHLLDFINDQVSSNQPFMAFLGFKTPHDKRDDTNIPARVEGIFDTEAPVAVPNLGIDPPFGGGGGSQGFPNTRNYMELLAAVDSNVVRVLDRLDTLGIASNTAVIYLSDNGYFRAEHNLGDKRAAYEESIRIPFMIRCPALHTTNRIVDQMVLNLDIAPTILDIAGVAIPDDMQGHSLVPLIEGASPPDWRQSFFFTYNIDPAYPDGIPTLIALRKADGRKLVRYAATNDWHELFNANTNSDPYEVTNLFHDADHAATRTAMETDLRDAAAEFLFLATSNLQWNGIHLEAGVQAGDGYPFVVQTTTNLLDPDWTTISAFEGGGHSTPVDLLPASPDTWDITVEGDTADYVLNEGPPVTKTTGYGTLRCGAKSGVGGKNAVLVFELPELPGGASLGVARLQVTAMRKWAKWDADLWAIGITNSPTALLDHHEGPYDDTVNVKMQDAFMDYRTSTNNQVVSSSLASGLSPYLRDFYDANPGYSGGQYLFLRLNPELDAGTTDQHYLVVAAESATPANRPQLHLALQAGTYPPAHFHRIRFGEATP